MRLSVARSKFFHYITSALAVVYTFILTRGGKIVIGKTAHCKPSKIFNISA